MNELGLQKLIVDAVNGAGGFARKMNNRFLIGVSDLIVKLPPQVMHGSSRGCPAGFLEVKQRAYNIRGLTEFEPGGDGVTHQQAKFLTEAWTAGMPCGVASFLQAGSGSGARYWLHIKPWYDWKPGDKVMVRAADHIELSRKPDARANDILTHLYNWQRAWREGK